MPYAHATRQDIERDNAVTRRVERMPEFNEGGGRQAPVRNGAIARHIVYTEDLAIPTDTETETTATATMWGGAGDSFADQELEITVTSRNPNFAAFEDDAGLVLRVNGEWHPLPFPPPKRKGKTDAAISKGGSGTVSVYSGTAGSETDTSDDVTAYNTFGDVSAGKWVNVEIVDGAWEITMAECG